MITLLAVLAIVGYRHRRAHLTTPVAILPNTVTKQASHPRPAVSPWLGLPVEAVAGAASEELARPARLTLNRVQPRLMRSVGPVPGRQLH